MDASKEDVQDFWEAETCGQRNGISHDYLRQLDEIQTTRCQLIPEIMSFAGFPQARGKKVLEIGVGMGTDFAQWVNAGAEATGVDLTAAA